MEQIIFYILMFCMGCTFGSFFTLAVYRIPLHQDITHKRSYCPNCNHKLSFKDMIPVLSYILLKGKCRYCHKKIRIRYFILEILTGIVFLLFSMSLNLKIMPINTNELIKVAILILYIAGIIIIAGIDKETRKIQKSVILYELVVTLLYMVYLYIIENANMYRYAIYLICLLGLIIIDNTYLRKKLKENYTIDILELSMLMTIFTGEMAYVMTVILTLLSMAIEIVFKHIKSKKYKASKKKISYCKDLRIGFYLGCCNIISLIIINFSNMWVIK